MTRVQRAIQICAIAASTPTFIVTYGWFNIEDADKESFDLAFTAMLKAKRRGLTSSERWAEAEAMLREGWVP